MLDLQVFFRQRDMEFQSLEGGGISTAFSTEMMDESEQAFVLLVLPLEDSFGDNFVRFTVVPFIDQPYDGYPEELFILIGQVNHGLPMLKFALDADNDLELALDFRAEELDNERFDVIIQMMADYCALYYPEINALVDK